MGFSLACQRAGFGDDLEDSRANFKFERMVIRGDGSVLEDAINYRFQLPNYF
jgi:hypothetical protein